MGETYEKLEADSKKIQENTPNVAKGMMGLFRQVMGPGALTVREKELIVLGISMSVQCEPCIFHHVKGCLDAGATKEQILEAAEVSVMMGGGPKFMHLPEVIKALEECGEL